MFEYGEANQKLGESMLASRRCTIAFFFEHTYGAPPEEEWGGKGGVLHKIMNRVGVPEGSKYLVRNVFEDVTKTRAAGDKYDAQSGERGVRREFRIQKRTPEASIIFKSMQAGVGITETVVIVNEFCNEKEQDNDPVSLTAVKNFIRKKATGVMHMHRRTQKKSGKEDEGTEWAIAAIMAYSSYITTLPH
jgi:hypothetical protein